LINHWRKWSIVDFTIKNGFYESLKERETVSWNKRHQVRRSLAEVGDHVNQCPGDKQPMIPVRLLLWARRYIQRRPVKTPAKWIQNQSVWSSMARLPRAGPQECVGRSDMHEGWTFKQCPMYVMKCQLNATSKSQTSKK
jgi:hypothetical protein